MVKPLSAAERFKKLPEKYSTTQASAHQLQLNKSIHPLLRISAGKAMFKNIRLSFKNIQYEKDLLCY
jgi:hypothetical protein